MAIQPGQTLEAEIDIAELYDVESSDTYAVQAAGLLQYADLNATALTGALDYSSNVVSMDIDGEVAKSVPYAIDAVQKRTRVSTSSCTSSRLSTLRTALRYVWLGVPFFAPPFLPSPSTHDHP